MTETHPAPPALVDELHCIHCQYNLRGLSPEGLCPECGKAIGHTLEVAQNLALPSVYVHQVRMGVVIFPIAHILGLLCKLGITLLQYLLFTFSIRFDYGWTISLTTLCDIFRILAIWWSIQLMAMPQQLITGDTLNLRLARPLRGIYNLKLLLEGYPLLVLLLPVVGIPYYFISNLIDNYASPWKPSLEIAYWLFNVAINCSVAWLLWGYLRYLSERLMRPKMAMQFHIVKWVGLLLIFLINGSRMCFMAFPDLASSSSSYIVYSNINLLIKYIYLIGSIILAVWILILFISLYQRLSVPCRIQPLQTNWRMYVPPLVMRVARAVKRIPAMVQYHGPGGQEDK